MVWPSPAVPEDFAALFWQRCDECRQVVGGFMRKTEFCNEIRRHVLECWFMETLGRHYGKIVFE